MTHKHSGFIEFSLQLDQNIKKVNGRAEIIHITDDEQEIENNTNFTDKWGD